MTQTPTPRNRWSLIGPGIVVAATGVGAGDLVATLIAGSRFGYALLWAAVVGTVLKIALAEAVGRTADGRAIRANGISAGPIKTLAASGMKDFGKLLGRVADASPLRRNVTIEDVGNVAAFLLSDLASGVTAEITYVDGGFSQTAGLSADQV